MASNSPSADYRNICGGEPVVEIQKQKGLKVWKLFKNSGGTTVDTEPEDLLGAIAELLFGTVVTCYFITLGNDWVTGSNWLSDNPMKNMVGYNNPCAFWDSPPALYFASLMFVPMVYFGIEYAKTDSIRADLAMAEHTSWVSYINWTYAASQCLLMGIFVVTPMVRPEGELTAEEVTNMHFHMRLHSGCFLQLVPMLCLAITANYIEGHTSGQKLSLKSWVALGIYVGSTTVYTICATIAIFTYSGTYKLNEPQFWVFNPMFMQCIDYCWFITLPIVTACSPPAPNLVIRFELAETDKAELTVHRQKSRQLGLPMP